MADESGAAVAEFSLLAIPLCLATISATNYCLNVYLDTLLRSSAIATTRFASLADVTPAQAELRIQQFCLKQAPAFRVKCQISFDRQPNSRVDLRIQYLPLSLVFFQPKEVVINVSSTLEIAK